MLEAEGVMEYDSDNLLSIKTLKVRCVFINSTSCVCLFVYLIIWLFFMKNSVEFYFIKEMKYQSDSMVREVTFDQSEV